MRDLLEKGRAAWIIGLIFVLSGILYWVLNHNGDGMDLGGAVLLVLTGGSMTFGFLVLLRGSRDL